MSRQIKFRCFYKIDNTMLEVREINFTGNAITPTCLFWSPELGLHEAPIEFERDFELMQYTGLKDKHGTEIYEGDIVKIDNEIYRVFYNDGSFRVIESESHLEHGRLFELMSMSDRTYCEVIGNIHQNGDLLDGYNS